MEFDGLADVRVLLEGREAAGAAQAQREVVEDEANLHEVPVVGGVQHDGGESVEDRGHQLGVGLVHDLALQAAHVQHLVVEERYFAKDGDEGADDVADAKEVD